MTARTARLAAVVAGTLALTVGLTACGDDTAESERTSQRGTALLAEARDSGAAASAVSFEQRTTGGGRAAEEYARRGDDSLVATQYDDGGRNEVRRVGGVVYARADLQLATGQQAPWVRIDPGADLPTWITILGDDLLAPTPAATADLLAAGVARVTAVTPAGRVSKLSITPKRIVNGERPTSISVTTGGSPAASFAGRSASVMVDGRVAATRTFSTILWGDAAAPITAPADAVAVDTVRDPQASALPAAVRRAPIALPAGWSLRSVVGITPSQGDGTCQQVLTLYTPTAQPLAAGYLAVYLKASGCPTPKAPGAADFTAGRSTGWIGQDRGASIGGLTVDGVSVRFRSSLPATELATVLATWQPLPA